MSTDEQALVDKQQIVGILYAKKNMSTLSHLPTRAYLSTWKYIVDKKKKIVDDQVS